MHNSAVADIDWRTEAIQETQVSPTPTLGITHHADVAEACSRIAPLWDLANYVAVNPFLGFSAQPLAEAARTIEAGLGAQVLPNCDFYRAQWQANAFDESDLARAADGSPYSVEALVAILTGHAPPLRTSTPVSTLAEQHDWQHGTNWSERVTRHVALWCAANLADGAAQWGIPDRTQGLYASWRQSAQLDRSLEIAGLHGWRPWVAALPATPDEAINVMAARLELSENVRVQYFYRLLGGVFGWASLLRRSDWASGEPLFGQLADLLAIRFCCDTAVAMLAPRPNPTPVRPPEPRFVADERVRLVLQEGLENGYARRLLGTLALPPGRTPAIRPIVQAIFCIDVRSEPLRRHFEAQHNQIETRGFAGFFGVSLDWQAGNYGSARCPVLLSPAVRIKQSNAPAQVMPLKKLWYAPASAYTSAETLGLSYAAKLVGDTFAFESPPDAHEWQAVFSLEPLEGSGVAHPVRVELATSILKNTGLGTATARLVLLCGHESHSANNSHAAGLDCGACGGHSGAINARVAAALLNDSAVRAALRGQGQELPGDTWFIAAIHNTATDEVTLLDTDQVPATHHADLQQLQGWLAQASTLTRHERAASLGLGDTPASMLDRLLRRRARDWSEVRPEWGLARNAAFIAARRSRTRGVDLQGRAFLHEYDWTSDEDTTILGLILSAPMVVASWINLQYFASTVDAETFGCGTKALHNRIGTLGVVLGNGGDLRTGLPLQSVQAADGSWYHEPLRLQVIVEAPQTRIDQVLAAYPGVRELFENAWLRLFALDPDSNAVAHWLPGRGWQAV